MSKHTHKEKSTSFWKKLGLGKNKSSISSLKSEPQLNNVVKNDNNCIKNKRLSMFLNHQSIPEKELPPPPTPKPTHSLFPLQRIKNQEKIKKSYSNPLLIDTVPLSPIAPISNPSPIIAHSPIITHSPVIAHSPILPHPQSPILDTKSPTTSHEQKDISTTISTEQPNVTPSSLGKQNDNESLSSFVVLDSNEQDLLLVISDLKSELEKEKATIQALQKQKQAVAKDLDYFELTVDELLLEKSNLIQQLEDEKITSQHHLEDLNLLLLKVKSAADKERDQSLAKEQIRLELENLQRKSIEEKESLLFQVNQKDKTIQDLKSKLIKSEEVQEELKETINQLIKSHAEELSRTVLKLSEENDRRGSLLLHTPNGSPRIKPDQHKEQEDRSGEIKKPKRSLPVPNKNQKASLTHTVNPQPVSRIESPVKYRTFKDSIDSMDSIDLDDHLLRLTKEKEKLQSSYSKIPLTGGGPKSRRRKEELEAMLDQVDSQLSKVKQKIKRS